MSQADLNIDNVSRSLFRAEVNASLQALASLNAGATAPSTTYAYQLWADTTTGILKMRNAANSAWTELFKMDVSDLVKVGANSTITSLTGLTTPLSESQGGTGTSSGNFNFKNRIINGAMMIDQRNAGASVATSAGLSVYTLDRWQAVYSQVNKFTVQQNAGAVTPPAGFRNYLGITSSSAYSVGASELFHLTQSIEGFNVADLGWGTASASAVTIGFWVRSSLTGTFGGVLNNLDANRFYGFTYTISSANTWEFKTVTIAGDTSGTWLSNNSVGLGLRFGLGVGSSFNGAAGSWGSTVMWGVTGATSVVGTNGATFYITGVQLEKGSTATSFDYRPYGQELALCQRYAYTTSGSPSTSGTAASTTEVQQRFVFPVIMRASPTTSVTTSGSYQISDDYNADYTASTVGITETRTSTLMGRIKLSGFTGLTAGRFYGGSADTATAKITFNSEL